MNDLIKPDFVLMILLVIILSIFWGKNKVPSTNSIITLFNALNTRGGNIALLSVMVMIFTSSAMRYIYFIIGLEVAGKLTKESALAMNGFTFVTGSVAGMAIGAWLKAMSPQDMPIPSANVEANKGIVNKIIGE